MDAMNALFMPTLHVLQDEAFGDRLRGTEDEEEEGDEVDTGLYSIVELPEATDSEDKGEIARFESVKTKSGSRVSLAEKVNGLGPLLTLK